MEKYALNVNALLTQPTTTPRLLKLIDKLGILKLCAELLFRFNIPHFRNFFRETQNNNKQL